jgi:hypothetical protein
MNDLKGKTKEKIQDAADAAKKAADLAVENGREVAHKAGKKMRDAGKRLQKL